MEIIIEVIHIECVHSKSIEIEEKYFQFYLPQSQHNSK